MPRKRLKWNEMKKIMVSNQNLFTVTKIALEKTWSKMNFLILEEIS